MSYLRCFIVLFLMALLSLAQQAPVPLPAKPAEPAQRAHIALALNGGGALGLAHIGVLRWMEEHHIPVDGIAGTSMGGLVGGFYASGMSAQELDDFVHTIDWKKTLNDEPPYRDLAFRRKEDKRAYPADLEFGLKNGITLPSGFNSGQQVGLILDRISAPYFDLTSFDQLPTPFRCVASDLTTGRQKVFDRGSLAEALRATMSLPAIFRPVRDKDQIYVDGGLLDNLPVDVSRNMGDDIVIAVELRGDPVDPKSVVSALDVLQHSVSVIISSNELESMRDADILISVNTGKIATLDFGAEDRLIDLGYQAAQQKSKVLQRFAMSDADWKQYQDERQAKRRVSPIPQFVKVTGTEPQIARGLEKNLVDNAGRPLNYNRLDRDLDVITGLGRFSVAGYQFTHDSGRIGLLVHPEEKDYGPPLVNPLIYIDGSDYANVRFNLGARITFLDIGGFGSEWRNDIIAGSEYGIYSEYYHPLKWSSPFFFSPRFFANTTPFDIYDNNKEVANYRDGVVGAGFDLGVAFNRYSQLRVGYQLEHENLSQEIGTATLPNFGGRQGFSRLLYTFDTTDSPTLPRKGINIQSRVEFYDANPGATQDFPLFETRAGYFYQVNQQSSVFLLASGGTTFGRLRYGIPPFSLGGPLRLAAYGENEILTNQYYLFQPGYIRRLKELSGLFGNNLYAIANYEIAKPDHELFHESSLPNDANVALLLQTIFGPIVVGGTVGDSNHRKFYFAVGRYF